MAMVLLALAGPAAQAQEPDAGTDKISDTRNDPSWTPWIDPSNPNVVRLNKDDPSAEVWRKRRDTSKDPKREAGLIDLQRYEMGFHWQAFPTFFRAPVALNPEDLKAGNVEVAVVGATTDNNPVKGTSFAANHMRSFLDQYMWNARGAAPMEPVKSGGMDQYTRTYLTEINIADYGNINANILSVDKSVEETRKVLGEILSAGAIPLLVGGSHDNQYGLYMAAADKVGAKNYAIVHFDSHMDAVSIGFGFFNHNGNGIYWVVENGVVNGSDVVQVGMTSVFPDDDQMEWGRSNGIRYHYQPEIEKDGWEAVMKRVLEDVKGKPLVVSIDIDIMSMAYVPGTGGREPDGPTAPEMMKMVRALAIQNDIIAFDIAEFNPVLDDTSQTTAITVDRLMRAFIAGLAAKKRGVTDPFYYAPEAIDDGK
jgi:agmatinase